MKRFTPLRLCFKNCNMSSEAKSENWRGVPLSEMFGSQSPWGAPEWPLVSPGHSHAVLYHVYNSGVLGDRPPKPQIGHDKWDSDHVRLPCSTHSLYPVEDSNHETQLKKRWLLIEAALWKPIRNSQELAATILSYNTKFKSVWKFRSLHKLFNQYLEEEESQYFFDVTLPEIAKLALALPKLVQSPIPLLTQHKNQSVSLSQQQISSLLANAFFCTFPRRNTAKRNSEYSQYPLINFNRLYETGPSDDVMEKLKCICHYFRRVCTKVPVGVTTFTRRSVIPRRCPIWHASTTPLATLPLHVDPDNTIENADGLIQVDFANKYLGGGVLGHGCVQEEIRFVICPELMISMLFTAALRHNEALLMIGCERYSTYSGYGHSFHWTGDFVDQTPFDSSQRKRVSVLAIDALPYSSEREEFRREAIARELNKAWIGFSLGTEADSPCVHYPGVATGNWGCGAFGGSPQLKSLVQMMACVEARRPMAYYTFKDMEIRDDVIGIYNLLARYNVTVGQLYKYILMFSQTDVRGELHAYIHQKLRDDEKKANTTVVKQDNAPVDNKTDAAAVNQDDEAVVNQTDAAAVNQDDEAVVNQTDAAAVNQDDAAVVNQTDAEDVKQDPVEKMETSASSDISQLEVSTATINAALNETQESPDLFSQGEFDDRLTEVLVHKPQSPTPTSKADTLPKRSKLVEEMQKLDEQSGRLNLVSNTSPFQPNTELSTHSPNASMDTTDCKLSDSTTELKKKICRKITDYFGKKTI